MKIVTVCGNGCGTSLLLKMTVETVLRNERIDATVEHTDINSASSIECDFFICAKDLESLMLDTGRNFVAVNNLLDINEVKEAILPMCGR